MGSVGGVVLSSSPLSTHFCPGCEVCTPGIRGWEIGGVCSTLTPPPPPAGKMLHAMGSGVPRKTQNGSIQSQPHTRSAGMTTGKYGGVQSALRQKLMVLASVVPPAAVIAVSSAGLSTPRVSEQAGVVAGLQARSLLGS